MITELDYLVLSGLSYGDFKEEDIGFTLEEIMFINKDSKARLMSFPNEVWPYGGADIFEKTFNKFLWKWKVVGIMDDTFRYGKEKTGFYAIAFEKNNEIVISYRGSENSSFGEAYKDFIETDLLIGMDKRPRQFEQGVEFYKRILEETHGKIVSLTGHSLGGGIAQYVALISDLEYNKIPRVFTWNAIGIKKIGILSIDNFVKLDPLIENKYPELLNNKNNYKKIKNYYYTTLIKLLKREGYLKGKESIKKIQKSEFKLEIDSEVEKKFEELLTVDNKFLLSFFNKNKKEEVKSRELVISTKALLNDCFDPNEIYNSLTYAREFIKKFNKNKRYDDYITNFVHTEDFTITLYSHLGSTYAINKGLLKINEEYSPLLKKVYAFTKSVKNYHMYQVFLPFFNLEGIECGKITKDLSRNYIATEVRKIIYQEKNFKDEFLGFYYNGFHIDEDNYYKRKKEIIYAMEKTRANIKYLKESIIAIKRMDYNEFKDLCLKVKNKIGSPFIKQDVFDLIIFNKRHK